MSSGRSDDPKPNRPEGDPRRVERSGPPAFVIVRICEWCGSEPLADTNYCENCDLERDNWLEVRYFASPGAGEEQ